MQAVSAPGFVSAVRRLVVQTDSGVQFLDITDDVAEAVRSAGLTNGIVTVYSRHTTAAVRIQEDEPLLLEDLRDFLARCAPCDHPYRHNDFRVRTEHMHEDESPNGHSHCLHLLLGSSETIPVTGGGLMLGTWQRIFLVELDGPRDRREVILQLVGAAG